MTCSSNSRGSRGRIGISGGGDRHGPKRRRLQRHAGLSTSVRPPITPTVRRLHLGGGNQQRYLFRLVGTTHRTATAIRTPPPWPSQPGRATRPRFYCLSLSFSLSCHRSRAFADLFSAGTNPRSAHVYERPRTGRAKLESGLGSRPHEFESRILRRSDKGKRSSVVFEYRAADRHSRSFSPQWASKRVLADRCLCSDGRQRT